MDQLLLQAEAKGSSLLSQGQVPSSSLLLSSLELSDAKVYEP